jgi:hypothetical protein
LAERSFHDNLPSLRRNRARNTVDLLVDFLRVRFGFIYATVGLDFVNRFFGVCLFLAR